MLTPALWAGIGSGTETARTVPAAPAAETPEAPSPLILPDAATPQAPAVTPARTPQPAEVPGNTRLERHARKVLAKVQLQPQRFRWYHGLLAVVVLLYLAAIGLTKAKGWEMNAQSFNINFIRLAGVTLLLFFLGLIIYGIANGGNI
jgi:hypothetical protein